MKKNRLFLLFATLVISSFSYANNRDVSTDVKKPVEITIDNGGYNNVMTTITKEEQRFQLIQTEDLKQFQIQLEQLESILHILHKVKIIDKNS